jgi:choline kinase
MRVLILGAGVGTRISRHLKEQPKCCILVGNKPLIRHTFELFKRNSLDNIAIVTGYHEEYIFNALRGMRYTTYKNPFFRVTNSIASMWFAQEFIDENDDLIILNADLYLEDSMLQRLLEVDKSPLFLADSTRIENADYRFYWEGDRLLKFGKELANDETSGEYVGIAKIMRQDIPRLKQRLDELINSEHHEMWWEDVLYTFVEDGEAVYIEDIKGAFWAEVDFIEDYQRILEYMRNKG